MSAAMSGSSRGRNAGRNVDDVHLGPQPDERLRELETDRAGTEDEQSARLLAQRRRWSRW